MPIPGTVQITGQLAPSATTDTFPTHAANYGKGGVHHVTSLVERDAISAERRQAGMLCTVTGDPNIYRLEVDLLTWTVASGGGGGSPIPLHGTTAQRESLGLSFGPTQSGYPFYDTDLEALYFWNGDHWETSVVMGYGPRIAEYVGTPLEILPLGYRQYDRWTNTASPACTVYVCRAPVNTHAMSDWIPLGKQGA